MKRRVIELLLVACLGNVLLIGGPAAAHLQGKYDGNDSRSPLDINTAYMSHGDNYWWGALRMQGRIRATSLGNKGDAFVFVDSRGGKNVDYYLRITQKRGKKLAAGIYKYSSGAKKARGVAWLYHSKYIYFAFTKKSVKQNGGFIRWSSGTKYYKGQSYGKKTYYWDYAPDRGMKAHRMN